MKEPLWATELFAQVCSDEGRNHLPKINWGYSKSCWRQGSSGNYNPFDNEIRVVTKGEYCLEQKQVFLHEICHWLTRPRGWKNWGKKRSWHGKRFYTRLAILHQRYDCMSEDYQKRENNYMKRSVYYFNVPVKGGEV